LQADILVGEGELARQRSQKAQVIGRVRLLRMLLAEDQKSRHAAVALHQGNDQIGSQAVEPLFFLGGQVLGELFGVDQRFAVALRDAQDLVVIGNALDVRLPPRAVDRGQLAWLSIAWQLGLTQTWLRGNCTVPHTLHLPPTNP